MKSPQPYNEQHRLRVLRRRNILDTPAEECFDAITRKAARVFQASIALLTLVDENRLWFKSRFGLDVREIDRADALCAHVVAVDAPLVIENTSASSEFASSPLVLEPPHIMFYAGIPIRALTREPLGSFCIIDTSPRRFPWQDFVRLKALARQAEVEIEARYGERDIGSTRH